MPVEELVRDKAMTALGHLMEDDREFVMHWIAEQKQNARAEGMTAATRGDWLWFSGVAIFCALILAGGIAIAANGIYINQQGIKYEALKNACIERVLCECAEGLP